MKSYSVKHKKLTDCVPGSNKYVTTENSRIMLKCNVMYLSRMWYNKSQICEVKILNSPSQDGDALFGVNTSHSLGEVALKSSLNALAFLGRRGLSQAVKSDFTKKNIKGVANKYLDQAFDSLTSNRSKKIGPLHKSGAIDIHKMIDKLAIST